MDIALITVIENNNNLHSGNADYPYPNRMEDEAIACFTCWRKNGGELKDIPIYAMCPTKRTPSQDTIGKLRDLGVTYIEHYIPETDKFTCGFWNVPIAGAWMEDNLKEDFFIHTDLDMYLIREPTIDVFVHDREFLAGVGTLHPKIPRDTKDSHKVQFETCFINSWRENGFYKKWYNYLCTIESSLDIEIKDYSVVEEYVIDVMFNEYKENILPIRHDFQFGVWYPVDGSYYIQNTYFRHEHLSFREGKRSNSPRELLKYIQKSYDTRDKYKQ